MSDQENGRRLLENAYRLETPADNARYYAEFAESYDGDFAQALGYVYPKAIAQVFAARAGAEDRPVADIGCGTGLVAEALGLEQDEIDGVDISPEMLGQAQAKGLYRRVIRADLTAPLDPALGGYGAVVSAGAFTSGHLGPVPLEGLLGLARPGALFVIGVNGAFFRAAGFAPVLARLEAEGAIGALEMRAARIYAAGDHAHAEDRAEVLSFRKL